MFDISFTEIMVIAVVALLVVGPERLPKVARTIGHLLGRVRRYVGDVKNDIQREMEVEELNELHSSMQKAAHLVKNSVQDEVNELNVSGNTNAATIKSAARTENVSKEQLKTKNSASQKNTGPTK